MSDEITFGKQLHDLREERHLTVCELARRLGKPHHMISNYESGKKKPGVRVLKEIARELGVRYLDLERFLLAQVPDGRAADFVQEEAVQLKLPFEEDYAARITCQRVGTQTLLTLAVGKTRRTAF